MLRDPAAHRRRGPHRHRAAIMEKTLYAVAAGFVVVALGMWWLHRRNSARKAAAAGTGGCGSGNCGC
ncbi:hypothetical protein OHA72_27435 [Dactylosporangium sp. NBC_01737]|uniref:hypothetical protein n=1 Tax=Dactylosporangium sp. NBC_01737 TaxID=2975959 RepID=UPI002E159B0C|nr:hypothetical protein OHA72_27435 [Dactylosporangium sp. NBC_01737]